MFDLTRIPEIEKTPKRFKLLEHIPFRALDEFPIQLAGTVGDEVLLLLVDFETTGLDADTCEPVEIGLVQVSYSPSARRITEVIEIISQFEQPKKPISDEITRITGITNEMVKGHSFDESTIERLFNSSKAVVAHNARFDRSFSDARFKNLSDHVWGCSVKDVDWYGLGFESAKLEYLLLKNGYFYEGHRAAIDCLAMVQLFSLVPDALHCILEAAQEVKYKILAKGVSFANKDAVKDRGYHWDGNKRYWWTEVDAANFDSEKDFLENLCKSSADKNVFMLIDKFKRHT